MNDMAQHSASALHRRYEPIESRIGRAEAWLAETQAEIEREGRSAALDRQLEYDNQLVKLLRRQRDRLRQARQDAFKQDPP
jgi:hypothetical protein